MLSTIMKVDLNELWKYTSRLVDSVPHYTYIIAAVILFVGAGFLVAWKGFGKGARYAVLLALAEYIGLIYCSTFFFREAMNESKYDWHPFWTYQAIEAGKDKLIPEIIMNVVIFVPIGLLMGIAFKDIKWWMVVLIGVVISSGIEILQFAYLKGFSEVDDVMHNTLGCMVGYMVACCFNKITATKLSIQ